MGLEKRLGKVEGKIKRFKEIKNKSLMNTLERTWDLLYIVNFGGTFIRRYQKPHAEQLGWEEKDLTIRNAVYCGILPALLYTVLNQFFGENIGESFQNRFYFYPGIMFGVSLFRMGYSTITKKSIGAPSIYNAVGTSAHAIEEAVNFLRNRK